MKITLTLDCELVHVCGDAPPTKKELMTAVFAQCPVPSLIWQTDVDDGWQLQVASVKYEIRGEK